MAVLTPFVELGDVSVTPVPCFTVVAFGNAEVPPVDIVVNCVPSPATTNDVKIVTCL